MYNGGGTKKICQVGSYSGPYSPVTPTGEYKECYVKGYICQNIAKVIIKIKEMYNV